MSIRRVIFKMYLLVLLAAVGAVPEAKAQIDHNSPFPPFKIIDNVYYVGTGHLGIFLITTPAGHILIDSGFESTVPSIRASVEELGFSFRDIKIFLGSHWHHDHQEGDALIKELTGAQVEVMDADVADLRAVRPAGKTHPIDRILHDGDLVELGGITLTAIKTPGHTKGCTDWAMQVQEDGHSYDLLIAGTLGANGDYVLVDNPNYPETVEDFRRSFADARKRHVDIFLGAHPSFNHMWEKYQRLKARKPGDSNPFLDPAGYLEYANVEEQRFEEMLRVQLAKRNSGLGH